jgi:hypothetical protein
MKAKQGRRSTTFRTEMRYEKRPHVPDNPVCLRVTDGEAGASQIMERIGTTDCPEVEQSGWNL